MLKNMPLLHPIFMLEPKISGPTGTRRMAADPNREAVVGTRPFQEIAREQQTLFDSFSLTEAFNKSWTNIVNDLHPILKSVTTSGERKFQDTRNDIIAGFACFKLSRNRRNLDFGEFSRFLKLQVQSRSMAVAAMPTACSGAGSGATADAGR